MKYRMHYVTVVSMVYLTGYLRKRLNAKVLCNWVNISNIMNAIFLQRLGCLFDWQNILARMREKDGFLERQGGALSGLPLQVPQPNVWHLQKPLTRCLIVGWLGVGKVTFCSFNWIFFGIMLATALSQLGGLQHVLLLPLAASPRPLRETV